MKMPDFIDRLQSVPFLIADGATGSNLQARGMVMGTPAEMWVLEQPDQIIRLHQDFIDAGAEILLTCTFGATSLRLEQVGLSERTDEINKRAVELAKKACRRNQIYIAGSIGPTGYLFKPFGQLDEEKAFHVFAQQAKALIEAGVDLIVIETQFDLAEASAAIKSVRSISALPLVCSFSFDRGTRTMMGLKPAQVGQEIPPLGVDMIGLNCGRSLEDNLKALHELRAATTLPIWFKPNAGLPRLDDAGRPIYNITPEQMALPVQEWLSGGAKVVGGCCGTSPDHLRQIARVARRL